MFLIFISGETTFTLSILFDGTDFGKILKHLPWVAGCAICCALDIGLVGQHFWYKKDKVEEANCNDVHLFDENQGY